MQKWCEMSQCVKPRLLCRDKPVTRRDMHTQRDVQSHVGLQRVLWTPPSLWLSPESPAIGRALRYIREHYPLGCEQELAAPAHRHTPDEAELSCNRYRHSLRRVTTAGRTAALRLQRKLAWPLRP